MNTKLLLILGAVLGVLLLAFVLPHSEGPTKGPDEMGTQIAAGRFAVEQAGVRLLDESYTLLARPEGGYILLSQGEIHAPDQTVKLSQETDYGRDYAPSSYDLTAESKTGRQTISARSAQSGLVMEARAGLVHQANTIKDAKEIALLDNNVVSHYAVLLLALRAGALKTTFTAAIPQLLVGLPAKAEGPEKVEFRSGDEVLEGTAFRVHIGDTAIVLVEREGRLVGLVNETQGIVAFDSAVLPKGFAIIEEPGQEGSRVGIESEVAFPSGDLTLAGTLTLPASGREPFPAALLIHGSGPVDRDENAPGLKTDVFRQLAEALAASGIASFRFDKRGVGESGGDAASASRADLLDDVRAALDALRAQPEVDGGRIVLIGHSEGAYLAPIVVAEDPKIAGLVLLAGAARSLAEITRWQVETLLRLQGASDEQVSAALAQEDQYLAFVKGSEGEWDDYSFDELKRSMPWLTEQAASALVATPLSLSWLREHYTDDPQAWLRRVSVPVLVVNGGKDLQIPSSEADGIRAALAEGKNPEVTIRALDDLNHLLRHHPEAPSLTYRHLDEPVDARVLDAVTTWLKRHFVD
ncbi:MAG: alpha/beta fold hydrolase [Candidatus Bipolaricaulota bacterium]|nr:alpha/beta fold hydrolase [Candidatus Bipolaricaulota bacterium]